MPDNSTASHAVGTLPTVSDGQAQPVDANRLPVPCRAARGGRAARPGLTVAHPIRDIRPVTPMSYRCHVIPASLATDQIRPGGGAAGRSRRHTRPAGVLAARVDRAELRDALGARGFGDSQRERSPMRDDRSKRRRVALLSPRGACQVAEVTSKRLQSVSSLDDWCEFAWRSPRPHPVPGVRRSPVCAPFRYTSQGYR